MSSMIFSMIHLSVAPFFVADVYEFNLTDFILVYKRHCLVIVIAFLSQRLNPSLALFLALALDTHGAP